MEETNLEWQTFDGSLPNGAVSIYNRYVGRTDYVAKYGHSAGFYNPDKGPYCYYSYYWKERRGSPFEILVNKDNFELLEWKGGSHGSVPQNSVRIGPGMKIYVGKNEYGLGKVEDSALYLPLEGSEHWYKTYEVLTLNKDVLSEKICDVEYKTDEAKITEYPPETLDKCVITNHDSQSVTGTATVEKTTEKEQRWDTNFSFTLGVSVSITAQVPLVSSLGVTLSTEMTTGFSKGTSVTESTTHSVSIQSNIQPNHACTIRMVGYKSTCDIPFTACVERTYRNGKTTWMSITGTYKGVQIGEVQAVVDRAEPLHRPAPFQ